MAIRMSTQFETVARLLLLGWTATQIARHLHVTPERVRYTIAKPEFEKYALALHKEHLQALDRKIGSLLYSAVKRSRKISDPKTGDAGRRQMLRKLLDGKIAVQPITIDGRRGFRLSGRLNVGRLLRADVLRAVEAAAKADENNSLTVVAPSGFEPPSRP
jgi:hypothetical protein